MTDGARYLLIPGFSQTRHAWNPVVAHLPAGPRCELLDIPDGPGFADSAAELAGDRAGIWAGYSMGGRLALRIALDRPDAVQALVLISSSPGIADRARRGRRRRDDEELAAWIEAHDRDAFLERWIRQPLFAALDPAGFREHRLESVARMARQLRLLGPGVQEPLWHRLGELTMPVLVAAGERDAGYAALAREMVAAIGPTAELHLVPGAGHALLLEQPGAVARLLTLAGTNRLR